MNTSFEKQMEENVSLLQRMSPTPLSRRKVLLGGGAGALALVAAACGGEDDTDTDSTGDPEATTTSTTAGEASGGGDPATAMLAAGLELLAVNTYQAALDAAGDGTLPDVPEAVATFITTAQGHHQEALDEWNSLLTALGAEPVEEVPEVLADTQDTVNTEFAAAAEAENPVVAVAELAMLLEQTAADTYFEAIPTIENEQALALAASIQPIDMQHAAVLNYVLGNYPVPDTFASAENSAIPA